MNKRDTAVQLTHLPTKLALRCEGERSQLQNKMSALGLLRARLAERQRVGEAEARAGDRKAQVGSGMRGDKVRTIALQRDQVTDHRLERTISAKRYLRGDFDELLGD